jgi:hypothetical protein
MRPKDNRLAPQPRWVPALTSAVSFMVMIPLILARMTATVGTHTKLDPVGLPIPARRLPAPLTPAQPVPQSVEIRR